MDDVLLQQLRALRNEVSHGRIGRDAESLRTRLVGLGVSVPPDDLERFVYELTRGFADGTQFLPPVVAGVVRSVLKGRSARVVCDPWAGFGVLAATIQQALGARRAIACVGDERSAALGRVLAPQLDWQVGDSLAFLETMVDSLDVVASVLPFGVRASRAMELRGDSGEPVHLAGDLGPILLAAASLRLSPDGLGLFLVTPSFFLMKSSVLHDLPRLGLGVEAAFALPAGSFSPFTSIATYLIVVRKRLPQQMFVAQLSQDLHTNEQVVDNFREGRADGAVELGRFVAPHEFRGLDSLRLVEALREAEHRSGTPPVRLEELLVEIRLGRPGDEFAFPTRDNALYIPMIGTSNVVDSTDAMTLKPQNYAQVAIDPTRSDARFVARFLNSELGRAIRDTNKSGMAIPKLNTSGLKNLLLFVPNLETQKGILEIVARTAAQRNMIRGLQNELDALERELWQDPNRVTEFDLRLQAFSSRLGEGAGSHVSSTLEQWFETLPFPLASILRAWQATPSEDFKTKYEHLLHFFEATAEFASIVYLSAFAQQPGLFAEHKHNLARAWQTQRLSLERATFGTWKTVVEYFSKQTRALLSGDSDQRTLCAELFADPTQTLPRVLASKDLVAVLSTTSKMRNDWPAHGGVVGEAEARLRNEQLLAEVQKLWDLMGDDWRQIQLIRALYSRARQGMFDNEVAVLAGSNSEFVKETRSMSAWLDVERLYVATGGSGRALLLLPLIQVGPSPASAKNACYFFSRLEKDGARFVSYHFVDKPESMDPTSETSATIRDLAESGN
ncbi:MAG: hypothetical protein JXA57_16895 [Armatimonadetes bacterium]|nr:hypothetical protein [Armatimonadota bacterium]